VDSNLKILPSGNWEKLLHRVPILLNDVVKYGGVSDPFWTLGGGTVLMLRYHHRLSNDIDIFVPDPQYLGFVTPRLSDTAADLTENYEEQPSAFVKLLFEEGEIDFVASPNLLPNSWENWNIGGTMVKVETASEIIAKKMFHRGDRVTARDLFDLALVIEREPKQLLTAAQFLLRHREAFLAQIRQPHASLRTAFNNIATLEYTPSFDHCVAVANDFLGGLKPSTKVPH
jgi:hypothetical protein